MAYLIYSKACTATRCLASAILLILTGCGKQPAPKVQTHTQRQVHTHVMLPVVKSTDREPIIDGNGIYYWKTVFSLSSWDREFMRQHNVTRLYLRLFDVDYQRDYDGVLQPIPIATVSFKDALPADIDVVPVIYLTSKAIESVKKKDDDDIEYQYLAIRILRRIKAMARRNRFEGFKEVQLDCDWTENNKCTFFDICKYLRERYAAERVKLSCTIRLHQLRGEMPPVDRGVLMVYNTGSLYNPKTRNSILDYKDVAPHLRKDIECDIPLSVAYPTYSWGLLMRNGKMRRILHHSDFSDKSLYRPQAGNKYLVRRDHYLDGQEIKRGDIIRRESSNMSQIAKVQTLLAKRLKETPRSTIIYHLDSANLSAYSQEDIHRIFNPR